MRVICAILGLHRLASNPVRHINTSSVSFIARHGDDEYYIIVMSSVAVARPSHSTIEISNQISMNSDTKFAIFNKQTQCTNIHRPPRRFICHKPTSSEALKIRSKQTKSIILPLLNVYLVTQLAHACITRLQFNPLQSPSIPLHHPTSSYRSAFPSCPSRQATSHITHLPPPLSPSQSSSSTQDTGTRTPRRILDSIFE